MRALRAVAGCQLPVASTQLPVASRAENNFGSAAHRAPRRFSGGFRFDYVSIPPGASRRRPLREATTSLQKTTANGGRAVLRNRSAKVDLKRNAPKPIRFGTTLLLY